MTLTPEEIAGRLTKAQRRAFETEYAALDVISPRTWTPTRAVLLKLGIVAADQSHLTPLGLAIRQHIEREG